jgi:hypothetical protein
VQRGWGYLFLSGFSSLYDAIHGWMTGRMDGWKKLHEKRPQRLSLYVIVVVAISIIESILLGFQPNQVFVFSMEI